MILEEFTLGEIITLAIPNTKPIKELNQTLKELFIKAINIATALYRFRLILILRRPITTKTGILKINTLEAEVSIPGVVKIVEVSIIKSIYKPFLDYANNYLLIPKVTYSIIRKGSNNYIFIDF